MGIYILVSVLVIIACFLQILIVLVQNSKGGGLAANFTSAGQTMGIRKTADFLEKSTWTLAAAILIMCVVATATIPRGVESGRSRIQTQIQNAVDPNAIPTLPTAVPPTTTTPPAEGQQQPPN
ncbi:MAG TPA: preprotein translocase subunit SecG [Bacteroidales bacterium]|nr:preprotein translocase subunit SecG [Bacteroidales bacterium]